MNTPSPFDSAASESELVIFVCDRVNVSVCNTAPAVAALDALLVDAESVRKYAGRISFTFDGYENQVEELYENSVVRAFVHRLTEQFPYWLHFVSKDDDALFILVMCLMGPEGVTVLRGAGKQLQLAIDQAKFNDVVLELTGYMNGLHVDFGLSAEENSAMTREVKAWLERIFGQ